MRISTQANSFHNLFAPNDPLTWKEVDEAARVAKMNLFTGCAVAWQTALIKARQRTRRTVLAEFMLLNRLYRLERKAERTAAMGS